MMDFHGNDIADCVLRQFDKLPKKRKPQDRGNGIREWVPISGIVTKGSNGMKCVALATGMKCLPQNKISQAKGIVIHDWHAEILAIRSFNRFLLEECQSLLNSGSSDYVCVRSKAERTEALPHTFAIRDDIELHMYCSEAPCGDASMELTMSAQNDASPWEVPVKVPVETLTPETILHGRGYFSELGVVRRKPSRPDAPPTMSKSCSDKISLKQCTSLLSATASVLISPANAYLKTITLPISQHSDIACERAFGSCGRMAPVVSTAWNGGYSFHDVHILTTDREFVFSRRTEIAENEKLAASNLAAAWTPYYEESLVGGVLQGRKLFDPRGAGKSCKLSLWEAASKIAALLGDEGQDLTAALTIPDYGKMKLGKNFQLREIVKETTRREALKGWMRNEGGESFFLEHSSG